MRRSTLDALQKASWRGAVLMQAGFYVPSNGCPDLVRMILRNQLRTGKLRVSQ